MDDEGETDVRFRCPGCDEEVDVSADAVGQLVRCPYCSSGFFAAHGHTHAAVVDDTEPPPADDRPPADELNAVRIRQLSTLRRATLRTRSWWVIAALLALSATLDLLYKTVRYVGHVHAWGWRPTLLAGCGIFAAMAVAYAARQAARLGREAAVSTSPPPTDPPDFSPLGNGADRWRALDHVR